MSSVEIFLWKMVNFWG